MVYTHNSTIQSRFQDTRMSPKNEQMTIVTFLFRESKKMKWIPFFNGQYCRSSVDIQANGCANKEILSQ